MPKESERLDSKRQLPAHIEFGLIRIKYFWQDFHILIVSRPFSENKNEASV